MRNLNLLFNKTYYDALTSVSFPDEAVKACNETIYSTQFLHDRDYSCRGGMVQQHFLLQTAYPGLLIGTGYTHSSGFSNDEIMVGFSFDYVTGQPCIPGSTVKGMLRSHFKDHPQAVAALTGRDEAWVKELEREIFDNRDIFFDAVVYDSDRYGRLLGCEYITPHSSPTENPIPIRLLKILPGVRFEFRFSLEDSEKMTGQQKLALFQALLELFGIGAKTNVGFGILVPDGRNGALGAKEALPQEQSRSTPKARPAPAAASGKPAAEGMYCPHCQKWNFRFHPSGSENYSWANGKCFKCGGKIR